mmetsp:Transcript_41362/g.88102  ORF Transcript_41362/g.88102 Transcript_41362/m.88102 type:complete len:307 (-) Transcript_41362:8-928(-)
MLALLGMDHGVVLRHDECELLERLEVGGVGRVLVALHLVVDVGQEVFLLAVRLQILGIAKVISLCQAILHKARVDTQARNPIDGAADQAQARDVSRALGKAGHAHHHPMHGDEGLHRRIVEAVDIATDDRVSLTEADGVEAARELRIGAHHTGELSHLVVHAHEEAVALVLGGAICILCRTGAKLHAVHVDTASLFGDELPQRDHAHRVVCKVAHAVHHHDRCSCCIGNHNLLLAPSTGLDDLADVELRHSPGGVLGECLLICHGWSGEGENEESKKYGARRRHGHALAESTRHKGVSPQLGPTVS